jgi:dihydrofolate synthase / folylpolyglutamate synthase
MKPLDTLDSWLEYIAGQHGQVIDMGLARVADVWARMDIPSAALERVITVAGTNGKGTTVATFEALLRIQGFNVGVYTSPHLLRYNERVRLNGCDLDDHALCAGFAAVEQARAGTPLTYFEYGTLAALYCFSLAQPDFCVLEIGLGGRLDAVNLIDPELSVITTVDIDHVEWLGSDREQIGAEKAGILRPGGLFVCADLLPPQSVVDIAAKLACRSFWRDTDFAVQGGDENHWNWQGRDRQGQALRLENLPIGSVPVANVAAALQGLSLLNALPPVNQIISVLSKVQVPGRFQRLRHNPEVIMDVGHNPQAARYLRDRIVEAGGRWSAVFSALTDKDIEQIVALLADAISVWYCAPLTVDRAATQARLEQAFALAGVEHICWSDNVTAAYDTACNQARADERILVFGSFYTVAEVIQHERSSDIA